MTLFDCFAEAIPRAFTLIYQKRALLIRLAMVPVVVKFFSLCAIFFLGLETFYLRQGLILLPAHFLEAWLVITIILETQSDRAALYGPAASKADEPSAPPQPMAAMVVYVLIKLIVAFFVGVFLHIQGVEMSGDTVDVPPQIMLLFLFAVVLGLWAFRLVWAYIPLAEGFSLRGLLFHPQSFNLSLVMMMVWITCLVPYVLLILLVSSLLHGMLPPGDEEAGKGLFFITLSLVQAVAEALLVVTASLAVAGGLQRIRSRTPSP